MTESYSDLPIITAVEDNYGHAWRRFFDRHNFILTDILLKPGDLLTLNVTLQATLSKDMYCSFQFGYDQLPVITKELHHTFIIGQEHISRSIAVYVRMLRRYHNSYLHQEADDIQFRYTVLSA